MTQELQNAIESIRKLSPELNATTDQANAVVARVEKFLNDECSLGIATEAIPHITKIGDPLFYDGDRTIRLIYDRFGTDGRFHIGVRTAMIEDEDEDGDCREHDVEYLAWSQCSRGLKLRAFTQLPLLLQTIAHKADEMATRGAETAKVLDKILGAMKPK